MITPKWMIHSYLKLIINITLSEQVRQDKKTMQKIACVVLYFIVIFGLKKTVIRFFSTYLNSPSERGSEDKDKAKWMICKYFLQSFQRVSIVFVLIASLSN